MTLARFRPSGKMVGIVGMQINEEIRVLIERWCDRRDYKPLAELLPAWLANNGLTDGWAGLAVALRSVATMRDSLPEDERQQAKQLFAIVDDAVHRW